MKSNSRYIIKGFTILEVVVVIAILGIIVTIVSRSLNRFGDQIQIGLSYTEELSKFQSTRSTIWSFIHDSDSVNIESSVVSFYKNGEVHSFTSQNAILHKKVGGNWVSQLVGCEEISVNTKHERTYVTIPLLLNEKVANVVFMKDKDIAGKINSFYNSYGREF